MARQTVTQRLDPDSMPPWLATYLDTRATASSLVAGVNDDDCAVMKWRSPFIISSIDFLNARPIALELGLGDLRTLGRLATAATVSDLCGSGAQPEALLVGVRMPRESSEADFRRLMSGVRYEAKRSKMLVVGGDTKLGDSLAILTVGIGSARSDKQLFLKFRARPGDLLWTSGPLGACNAAVLGLRDEQMSDDWKKWAGRAITVPRLPIAKSRSLSELGVGSAGTDLSDGLAVDLHQLCVASGVGAVLYPERIPTARPVRRLASSMGFPHWAFAFGAGGDFQFIVTTPPRLRKDVARIGFHQIGHIIRDPGVMLMFENGVTTPLPIGGHRDAKGLSFADEIRELVERVAHVSD